MIAKFDVRIEGQCWSFVPEEIVAEGETAIREYLSSFGGVFAGNSIRTSEIKIMDIVIDKQQ